MQAWRAPHSCGTPLIAGHRDSPSSPPHPGTHTPLWLFTWMEAGYSALEKSFQGNSVVLVENISDFANNPVDVTGKTSAVFPCS